MSKFNKIIDKLFDSNGNFYREDFLEFISDITGKYPNDIFKKKSKDKQGNEYLRELVSIYEDSSGEKIAILVYKMPSASKVEKARSHQRNLISTYLKDEGVYENIDNVLAVFYNENYPNWRLSFVKQEFKLENGKIKNELTPAKRYSFLIEQNSKNLTVKQRLNELLSKEELLISDIEKAFSVEKVSKEFFERYKKLYEKLSSAFKNDKVFLKIESESNHGDENFRDNFVKKLLGQIVFLYFLQKKGWLGVEKSKKWGEGNKRFLQDLLDECLAGGDSEKELGGKNFFNDYLEHLFYDNLNKKREDDFSEYFNCKIPYLNGGLFEPINDYHWEGLDYVVLAGEENNKLFKEIFDTFDEYNFTVYENDPLEQDVAVDPEMLGKVFENLLPENERKGKGAFYTPREIVHYMCKESLKNHIINKTGINEERINKLFELKDSMLNLQKFNEKISEEERYKQFGEFIDYANKIVESLKEVKIVDPAVGSGAFPMGLLKEIVSLRKYLQENILLEDNVSEYKIKKETLENCIYGVDLDPGAVEIAKLRFWLSLVIEEDSTEKIDPLPNLDYKIMQGNSLIEDIVVGDTVIKLDLDLSKKATIKETKEQEKLFGGFNQLSINVSEGEEKINELLKKLKYLHKKFFKETDNRQKHILKEQIDEIEKGLIFESAEEEVKKLQAKIQKIEDKYKESGLAWAEKDAKKVAEWQSTIVSIKQMEEKYKRDSIRSFFPWKLHFGEVFRENGGFDIVIGNPPYVSYGLRGVGKMDKSFKEYLKFNYSNSAEYKISLYAIFMELGIKLNSNNGNSTYIVPDSFLLGRYFSKIRKFILENNQIINLMLIKTEVFESASVGQSVVYLFEKNIRKKNLVNIILAKSKEEISDKTFILNKYSQEYFNMIEYNRFRMFFSPEVYNLIVKLDSTSVELKNFFKGHTGIRSKIGQDNIISKNKLKETYKKGIISGGKVIKYHIYYDNDYINVDSKILHGGGFRKEIIENDKILLRQTSDKIIGAIDKEGFYHLNNIHSFSPINDEMHINYILSILNSKLIDFYYKKISLEEGRAMAQIDIEVIEKLPIKQISKEEQKPFVDLVDQILEITKNEDYLEREDLQKQVKVLEKKIDDMVYKLYDLNPEEIEVVEESLEK